MSLYGHTHREDIQIVKSTTDNKNIGFNFFAGSVTTHTWKNPSFNVIEFDAEYMIPVNIFSYSFDVNMANYLGQPNWVLLHDYLSYYSLPDLRPDNLNSLAELVRTNEATATLHIWNQSRRVGLKPTSCNAGCRQNLYCDIVAAENLQNLLCKGGLLNRFTSVPYNPILQFLVDEWITPK